MMTRFNLREGDTRSCRIKDVGGRALAGALKSAIGDQKTRQKHVGGFRLKGFDLQGNYFTPDTIAMLVENTPSGCMLALSAGSGSTMA